MGRFCLSQQAEIGQKLPLTKGSHQPFGHAIAAFHHPELAAKVLTHGA
jgi:hypothetical protein